ncbi:unnamed protein product [Caenorhabditis auriculariae]|uniref:Uncharacterized protein n=1 Tax=Caenorhabditis auriculariae TaxID=2777116 RepID=A0A8S1HMX6_9PELO|nr:unnamed protein product [Caenorhabditis auriculariae]
MVSFSEIILTGKSSRDGLWAIYRSSTTAESEFKSFLEKFCLANLNESSQLDEYLRWEQVEFLWSLRIMLEPSTESGDFEKVMGKPIMDNDKQLMFMGHDIRSNCTRINGTEWTKQNEDRVIGDNFETHILDLAYDSNFLVHHLWSVW